ncbi:sigma-54-dependent Fis family transcriptional regulator [Sphaerotilus mobilis]|uniref:Transcriptional regulator of acetoin/glycerol metabolism n=1 Tax=Sphaerotilus mobilis TaxID=47994 RepID=A0A4Q7LM32_9BURK|nr:sigma-54-dependent Fis family transcriptional regulator [Sphaerotilus mobilis]RZS54728.1 transcriptional regulator of acetoin/glycerol metabolism [Sphaerotilus mobilis]
MAAAAPLASPLNRQAHIATVMQVADGGIGVPAAARHDTIIRASWERCVREHRLDPTRMQEAVILPQARLREHQDQMDAFLSIARHGLESLYQQVAGQGYVVLLTDARGITVDFLGDLQLEPHLRRAGLYLGADWSEHHAGTCGVGTCLSTGQALTVHLDDHFDATHIPLTCTAAPVHDTLGRLQAVLDISQLSSAQPKESQHLALQLVKVYAQHVENAAFLQRHRQDWVLRLSEAPQFLDVNPDYLLALDEAGRVIGHNRRAQLLFEAGLPGLAAMPGRPSALIGQPLARLIDVPLERLGRYVQGRSVDQRAVRRSDGRQLLFLLASPPPGRPQVQRPGGDAGLIADLSADLKVPAPLAVLSAGDPALDRQIERAARLVNSPVSLLITGETGSGKELFAQAMHAASERRSGPFVAVNCAAIPESLIESELFGHLAGSFSGAGPKGKRGLIQEADGGTLFLDEIGDMPRPLQARLLRVLAEREVLPIGATRPVKVKLRVIAATHRPLEALVREGRFRDDLYYRLNGAHVQLPPLRERRDLDGLIDRMLAEPRPTPALSDEARAALHAHRWPGNLRELRNALDYARTVCVDGRITRADLPDAVLRPADAGDHGGADDADHAAAPRTSKPRVMPALDRRVEQANEVDEADTLRHALQAQRWNVSAVARSLGCSRMTLYRRMKRCGIVSPLDQPGAAGGL